jgi:hypothetical protein
MGKSYRKEVLKRLQQELESTTDTKEVIRIGNAIAKLTKPKRPVGRPPQKKPNEGASNRKTSSPIVDKWAASLSHLEYKKRIEYSVILEVEQRLKRRGVHMWPPSTENRAAFQEVHTAVMGMLSDGERATYDASFATS